MAPVRTSREAAAPAMPKARTNTACASRISAGEDEGSGASGIDIDLGSVYLADRARLGLRPTSPRAPDPSLSGIISWMSEARAFWVVAPGRGEIRAQRLRPLEPGELLIRTRASGISRGTETLVFRGEVPQSEWQRMRCPLQEGEFPAPVKYGYAVAGIVEDGATEYRGRRVFCLHPHQDRLIVPQGAVAAIPDDVPERRATLAANMETAVNGLWDGMPGPGGRIAVVGAGVVGALVAALAAQLPGAV